MKDPSTHRLSAHLLGLVVPGVVLAQTALLCGEEQATRTVPDGCDVLYERLSPDGKLLAFVGGYATGGDKPQHGLFVVEMDSQKVRRLLETAVKTAPAWSPDSTRLAIGNSPGYGNRYPLVIIDVKSGQILYGKDTSHQNSVRGRAISYVKGRKEPLVNTFSENPNIQSRTYKQYIYSDQD